jgi:hypothetical protein
MATYLIGVWYLEYSDGTLIPCQNRATAEYLLNTTDAIAIRDITREKLMA